MPSVSTPKSRLPVITKDETGAIRSVVETRPAAKARLDSGIAAEPLLQISNLTKTYWVRENALATPHAFKAVDGVSLVIPRRSTLGLVGESGCGKSTLSRLVMRLIEPDSGDIVFNGRNLATLDRKAMRTARRDVALIFRTPMAR